jgi:protein-disulfide isomerase
MRFCLLAALCLFSVCAQVKPKSAFDKATFESYVRHLLLVDPRVQISVDDPKAASIGGLKELDVHMTYMGRTQDEVFYASGDGKQVLYGKVFDISHSPFQTDLDKIHTDAAPGIGAAGAPLVVVLYSDFQCPACKEEAKTIRDNIVQTYPTQVRVYFKDFPLEQIHPWAKGGAMAGRCVYRQNAASFWDYYDWVYEHQAEVTPENLKDKVLEFAKTKNLDTLQLGRCMDTKATEGEVDKSLAEGKALKIDQTPTLFINGRRIPGSIPWQNMKQLIDAELEYAKTAVDTSEKCCEVKIPSVLNK